MMMFCLRCALFVYRLIYVLSVMPSIIKGLNKIDLSMCSSFFSYGAKLQIASIAGFFNFQIDIFANRDKVRIMVATNQDFHYQIRHFRMVNFQLHHVSHV